MFELRIRGMATGAAVLMVCAAAIAQEDPAAPHRAPHSGDQHPMLQRADQNGDGIISYDEAVESLPGMTDDRFERMDANADRRLDAGELQRGRRGSAGRSSQERFNEADTNQDGKLSREELQANVPRFPLDRFDDVDTDGDGGLTAEELEQSRMRAARSGTHRGPLASLLHQMDRDKNGEVSFEEFRAVRPDMDEERFSRADRDRSGGIDEEELLAATRRRTPEERRAFMNEVFDRRDADGSSSLSFEETQGGRRPLSKERFDRLDENGDGALTREEFVARFENRGPAPGSDGHRRPMQPEQN